MSDEKSVKTKTWILMIVVFSVLSFVFGAAFQDYIIRETDIILRCITADGIR